MTAEQKTIAAKLISAAIDLWANHAGKPKDWIPSTNDYLELQAEIDAATPEAEKEAARKRLGL